VSKNTSKNEPSLPSTYEEARAELEDVVRRLETGGVALEESLALWERGEQLAKQCQDWLDGARRRLDAAREPAGEAAAEPASAAGGAADSPAEES
jgi:exodeoxyribonuclease VII small subunit